MITGHCKHVHVLMELSPKCVHVFILGNTSELRPGTSNVMVVLQNQSGRDMTLKPQTEVGTVIAAKIVPTAQVNESFDVGQQEKVYICQLRWNPPTS